MPLLPPPLKVPAFPFCPRKRTAPVPRPGYPTSPRTLGEHLRAQRLDRGLMQREVARTLGVDPETLRNWETGKHEPAVRHYPAVFAFLGFDPRPAPQTLAGRLRRARERLGLSQRELGRRLGLDESTIQEWEAGAKRGKPAGKVVRAFEEFLETEEGIHLPPS